MGTEDCAQAEEGMPHSNSANGHNDLDSDVNGDDIRVQATH